MLKGVKLYGINIEKKIKDLLVLVYINMKQIIYKNII